MVALTLSRLRVAGMVLAAGLAMTACSLDSILKSDALPPDVNDPAITRTRPGALAVYRGVIDGFRGAFAGLAGGAENSYVGFGALLSDELQLGNELGRDFHSVDGRTMPEGVSDPRAAQLYSQLHRVRGQASQAIALLRNYAPDERAAAGHAYALQAYAELFLAEAYCSGIPLSTLDFDGDYTPRPGSSTEEVYEHALALLDTARTLVADDAQLANLVRVARARAHLGLGRLDDAASEAAEVPDQWRYAVEYAEGATFVARNLAAVDPGPPVRWPFSVSDREGVNGLDYRTSGDPRTAATLLATNTNGQRIYHPNKYSRSGGTAIALASAVEARLVEAEAALARGEGRWLTLLNELRTDGTFTTSPRPGNPAQQDTLWQAGSGGTAGLAPLADPADADARLDLLFRERAFWLFLTGHRQADLRRLVRHYGRSASSVYPVGAYPSAQADSYGGDVNAPVPPEERVANPYFTGCISRGA